MKNLIVLRGLPGSGKTTLANLISKVVHSADDYFYENGPNEGAYDFDMDKIGDAHAQCKRRTKQSMIDEEPTIVVANTNTTEKELKPYIKLAEDYGYTVTSIIVENRHGNKSVHGVPSVVMDSMEKRFTVKLR